MEHDVCNVIYLDRRAAEERVWTRPSSPVETKSDSHDANDHSNRSHLPLPPSAHEVDLNVQSILTVFQQVSVYRSSSHCLAEIKASYDKNSETKCTLLLIDIPSEEDIPPHQLQLARSPSPTSVVPPEFQFSPNCDDYGMDFLVQVSSDIRAKLMSPLVLPVAVLSGSHDQKHSRRRESLNPFQSPDRMRADRFAALESVSKMRYFDAGAADVITSPTSADRIRSLPAHAHWMKVQSGKKQSGQLQLPGHRKKTSWVGTKDDKPYTQLKEAMVCELMDHICNPELQDPPIDTTALRVDPNRYDLIAAHFSSWSFSAHMFTDDELLYGAFLMLDHALQMDNLEKWRMSKDELLSFLVATRRVYNSSVLYHNFRHACDVLQAVFVFLVKIGALPPLFGDERLEPLPMASLIDPFHALLLLISAIGHDVGHPGVNNAFLVTVNAPLAQLYNDRSVLESFHCAAYSQILRRYWKAAFNDRTMRRLMINMILATDMGLHRDYMSQMENLQQTFESEPDVSEWSDKKKEDARELLCCLLIKAADICNVARNFEVASEWARILIDEFYDQGQIEQDLNVPSALFGGPPDPNSLLQKCHSQIGFMTVFAQPLFSGMANLLPRMKFTVDAIDYNKSLWQEKIKFETERAKQNQQRLEDESIQTTYDSKVADDRDSSHTSDTPQIQTLPHPNIRSIKTAQPGRRGSAGIAAQLVGLPVAAPEARRSSLGPTVVPDLPKKKPSSASERQRRSLLKYLFCCGPDSPIEPKDTSTHLKRVPSGTTGDDEMNDGDSKEAGAGHMGKNLQML